MSVDSAEELSLPEMRPVLENGDIFAITVDAIKAGSAVWGATLILRINGENRPNASHRIAAAALGFVALDSTLSVASELFTHHLALKKFKKSHQGEQLRLGIE